MKHPHARDLCPLLLWALILGSCASGPLTRYKAQALYGMIYDPGNKPVGNVKICINGQYAASSDIHGRFAIPQMKPKLAYQVRAEKENYETVDLEIAYSDPAHVLYIQMFSGPDLLEEAERALAGRDWFRAESFLSRAEHAGARSLPLGYLRGVLAFSRGRHGEALTILLDLAETEKGAPFLFLFIADLYQYTFSDPSRARIFLEKFLDLRDDRELRSRLEKLPQGSGA
jgi:hypothetical protein